MSEFDDLEKELSALKPKQPSVHFVSRVEEALGEAGTIAVRRLDEREKRVEQIPRKSLFMSIFTLPVILGSTAFASLLFIAYISFSVLSEQREANKLPNVATQEDDDSPLHGVSLSELESLSAMPVRGWLDPITNERILKRVDEGVVDQPNGVPARKVRVHFMDETLWRHPASDMRVLSNTPRQETYLIDLELY